MKEAIKVATFFDTMYSLYNEKGMTSTPIKLMESLGLWDQWKEYIKLKEKHDISFKSIQL